MSDGSERLLRAIDNNASDELKELLCAVFGVGRGQEIRVFANEGGSNVCMEKVGVRQHVQQKRFVLCGGGKVAVMGT